MSRRPLTAGIGVIALCAAVFALQFMAAVLIPLVVSLLPPAEQFARDSHSSIGGIRRASQGIFEILPRDQADGITEASQIIKTVRVVSTIDYALGR